MIAHPLSEIHLISSWNIQLFNHWPVIVIVIGRVVYRIVSIASSHLMTRYKIYAYVLCLKVAHFCQSTCLMVSHLLLLPWCTAITGYQTSSNKSNSQQQLTSGYRQTSKSLPGTSWPTRVKTTINRTYAWQFKYASNVPTILSTSNGLLCGYIAGIYFCL